MKLLSFMRGSEDLSRLRKERQRYYREWLVIAMLALSGVTLFMVMQWGSVAGQVIYDQFHRWRAKAPADDIVVIAVDDASLDQLGGWPLKRSVYADLLQKMADTHNQPATVGFDILFRETRAEDEVLARQMRRHRVYLATEQQPNNEQVGGISPVLVDAAQGVALVNLTFESDGFLRGVRLVEGQTPQLALAMSGRRAEDFGRWNGYRRFELVDPQMGFPTVSLADALSGEFPLELFKGKHVLLGAVAPSLGDHYPTIYSGQHGAGTPGVFLHANILNALLRNSLISPVSWGVQLGMGWLVVSLALLALLTLSPLAEIVVTALLMLASLGFSWVLLNWSLWFDPAIPLFAMLLIKPVWVWRRNEMVVRYMMDRVAELQPQLPKSKRLGSGFRWRHFSSDTVFQYSRVLDRLIQDANERLGLLGAVIQESPNAMLVADVRGGRIVMYNPRMKVCMPHDFMETGLTLEHLLQVWGIDPQCGWIPSEEQGRQVTLTDRYGQVRHGLFHFAPLPPSAEQSLWLLTLVDVTDLHEFQAQRDRTLQWLSHDMRTPIASIIVLSRQDGRDQIHDVETFRSITRNASTLLQMMDDFILAIQADAPQYQMQEALVDEVIDEAVYQVKDWALSRQITWRIESSAEHLFIHADQRLLIRMLVNLLTNAIRYGQVNSVIDIEQTACPPSERYPHGAVQLRMRNMVGVPDEDHASPAARGFGLGLEFVRTVIRKHHGDLHLDIPAVPGKQATVSCQFPLSTGALVKDLVDVEQ